MKLISPTQYVRDATKAVNAAQHRVYLLSLVFADHEATHSLVVALEAAAKRGVKVVVAADIFTYGEVGGGFLPFRYYSHGSRSTNRMVKTLRKAGVEFHWLGGGHVTLYHGRTHSKWCIADDVVFTFGGVNLYEQGILNADYMFKLTDNKLADRLVLEQEKIQKAERRMTNYYSGVYEQDSITVLMDGGIIGQSVIYSRAVELAQKASRITFVSQYCPTGKLARIIQKKPSTVYFNRPHQAEGLNRIAIRLSQFLSGLQTSYSKPRYLHAKCIIFTFDDGTKTAITGSHNFAHTGVLLGTREIALETSDPKLVAQLESFIAKELH